MALATQPELSALSHSGAWGDAEKFWGDLVFLLIVPEKTIQGEVAFSLTMVWAYSYQAHLSSLDEVAKNLPCSSTLAIIGPMLLCSLMRMPKEGHLSAMSDGASSRNTCRHLCQLEMHQLLQCGDQVVYPKGLNGGLEPVLISLSGALVQGMNTLGEPAHEPSFLSVDFSWFTLGDYPPKVSAPCRTSTPTPPSHLAMEHPPKADSHINMTAEVWELLSHAMLDTSSQALGDFPPERPTSPTLGVSSPTRVEDSSKPVATSSQALRWVAIPENTKLIIPPPEVVYTPITLPTKTPVADTGALPEEVILLQEEMNSAMGYFLMTRHS